MLCEYSPCTCPHIMELSLETGHPKKGGVPNIPVIGLWNAKEVPPPIPGSLHLLTAIESRPQDVNERGELTLASMQGGPCGAGRRLGSPIFSDCFQETNRVIALNHWQGSNFRFLGTLCRHSSHSLLTNRLRSRPRRTSQVVPKECISVC